MFTVSRKNTITHKFNAPQSTGVVTPRLWQTECFAQLDGKPLRIVNAPVASGKSTMGRLIATRDIENGKKVIVAAPQLAIAKEFLDAEDIRVGKKTYSYVVPNRSDLVESVKIGRVLELHEFLKNGSGVAVCSHATIMRFFKEYTFDDITDTSIIIDEAHHLCYSDDRDLCNTLSQAIGKLATKRSCCVTLMTATPFRGDRLPILSENARKKFTAFDLPFDRHLNENFKWLKTIKFNFRCYDKSPSEVIKTQIKKNTKAIIHIPHSNSGFYNMRGNGWNKNKEVSALRRAIDTGWKQRSGLCGVWDTPNSKNILVDLVSDDRRQERVDYIRNHINDKNGPNYVVAMNVYKEGANYPPLNHSFIIDYRNSLTEMIQIMGRVLRDFKGKSVATIDYVLPKIAMDDGSGNFLEKVNNYLKAVTMAMILQDVMDPLPLKRKRKKTKSGTISVKRIRLADVTRDDAAYVTLVDKIRHEFLSRRDIDALTKTSRRECMQDVVATVLGANNKLLTEKINREDIEDIAHNVQMMFVRKNLLKTGAKTASVDIWLLDTVDAIRGDFVGRNIGVSVFNELRQVLIDRVYDKHSFIKRARTIHSNTYDYSEVVYVNNHTNVKIKCEKHGIFEQRPNNHLDGKSGCGFCFIRRAFSTEQFIERAKAAHGNTYDYNDVEYVNNHTKVKINCEKHGAFEQVPSDHWSGKGCSMCRGGVALSTKSFIKKAKAVHGNTYDYNDVEYVSNNTKVKIKCKKHGIFEQVPASHWAGSGCPVCSGHKLTKERFIERAKKLHNNVYDYSEVDYVNSTTKIKIKCKKHGVFEQIPNSHSFGAGCPRCAGRGKTQKEFLQKVKEAHGDRYDYSEVEFINDSTKVKIKCETHGVFWQAPVKHWNGRGCPSCGGCRKLTKEEFLKRAKETHGDRYDYSGIDYINLSTKVIIKCKKHGTFEKIPKVHINNQRGCPACGYIARRKS